jgi:hypothetical protein
VKLWRLDEGRQPWTGQGCLRGAERELSDHESAVVYMDADLCGGMVLTGTEEGTVTLWDLRQQAAVWQVRPPPFLLLRDYGAVNLSIPPYINATVRREISLSNGLDDLAS